MKRRSMEVLYQLHHIYGSRMDSIINHKAQSPIYLRTCHLNQIQKLRDQWSHRAKKE